MDMLLRYYYEILQFYLEIMSVQLSILILTYFMTYYQENMSLKSFTYEIKILLIIIQRIHLSLKLILLDLNIFLLKHI